jgi:hypothetical protein
MNIWLECGLKFLAIVLLIGFGYAVHSATNRYVEKNRQK